MVFVYCRNYDMQKSISCFTDYKSSSRFMLGFMDRFTFHDKKIYYVLEKILCIDF